MIALLLFFLLCSVLLAEGSSTRWRRMQQADDSFDYSTTGGGSPTNWGDLEVGWELCSEGVRQSPINIPAQVVTHAVQQQRSAAQGGQQRTHLSFGNTTMEANLFHGAVNLICPAGQYCGSFIAPTSHSTAAVGYQLRQLHWHSPSEHTLDGQAYDLEAHMIFANSSGAIVAVALLFEADDDAPNLEEPMALSSLIRTQVQTKAGGWVDAQLQSAFSQLFSRSSPQWFHWRGSVTTPPCREGVLWWLASQPLKISRGTLEAYRSQMAGLYPIDSSHTGNARPTQPLHHRTIEIYPQQTPRSSENDSQQLGKDTEQEEGEGEQTEEGEETLDPSASFAEVIWTACVLGVIHVLTGPDHLSALIALSAGGSWRSFFLGLRWGLGHTTGLFVIAAMFFALDGALDLEVLGHYGEITVGFFMLGLGFYSVCRARRIQQQRALQQDHYQSVGGQQQ